MSGECTSKSTTEGSIGNSWWGQTADRESGLDGSQCKGTAVVQLRMRCRLIQSYYLDPDVAPIDMFKEANERIDLHWPMVMGGWLFSAWYVTWQPVGGLVTTKWRITDRWDKRIIFMKVHPAWRIHVKLNMNLSAKCAFCPTATASHCLHFVHITNHRWRIQQWPIVVCSHQDTTAFPYSTENTHGKPFLLTPQLLSLRRKICQRAEREC